MILKGYTEFITESNDSVPESDWIYEGGFTITKNMVKDGRFIKGKIPNEITGYFNCNYSDLTSLEGGPTKVGGYFHCTFNSLTSLEGGPTEVGGHFSCRNNQLTSLEHGPKKVSGDFNCGNNQLTSLEGGPEEVSGEFNCRYNQLTTFEHGPTEVGGNFYFDNNNTDLSIEVNFIKSGNHKGDYWTNLLKYCIESNIDLNDIKYWPKEFLTDDIIKSVKGLTKYKL